ncbi:MAG: hypothetical protein ACYS74_21730 [Planctomycetota bacterium]|jgi:hypothetical protein
MRVESVYRAILGVLLILQLSTCLAAEAPDANDSSKYLDAVRTFADNVLQYGLGTYDVTDVNQPGVIYLKDRDLQQVIDEAMPHSIIICDPNRAMRVKRTVTIHKPLTIMGLHAFLQPGLGYSPIVAISAEGVKLRDFRLRGNVGSVPVEQRASLIAVRANNFIVENGIVTDSARHGITVSARQARANVHTGIVRNITGKNIARDVVSIEGHGDVGYFVHHVTVENIKGFDSHERGAVEVCDGTENIMVRNVYAENCVYGVDVQDHGYKGQINRDISIIGVEARNCGTAVRTAQSDLGHSNLMILDISSDGWREREQGRIVSLRNTSNILLANIKTTIHGAARSGALDEVKAFVENGIDVDERGAQGMTPPRRP